MPNGIHGKLIHGRTLTWIYGRKKLKPNWIDNQSDWLLYLAGNRSSRLVQILLYAFCFEIPLSICLSVLPFLLLLPIPMFYQVSIPIPCTVTMAIPGLWRHSAVVQCLCPFLILLCLSLCFVWLIMSGLSNSVSISKVVLIFIYFISLMFHSVFLVVFGLFIFLQLISFWSSSFHSLHNMALVDRGKIILIHDKERGPGQGNRFGP